MNKKTFEAKYDKQIEVFEKINSILTDSIQVFEEFNGKVINVRIEKALKEHFKNLRLYIKVEHFKRDFTLCNWDNDYYVYNNDGTKSSYGTYRVDDYEEHVYLAADGERLDIDFVKNNIDHIVKENQCKIEKLKALKNDYDSVRTEYKSLMEEIKSFKDKYNYVLRDDCNCTFDNVH